MAEVGVMPPAERHWRSANLNRVADDRDHGVSEYPPKDDNRLPGVSSAKVELLGRSGRREWRYHLDADVTHCVGRDSWRDLIDGRSDVPESDPNLLANIGNDTSVELIGAEADDSVGASSQASQHGEGEPSRVLGKAVGHRNVAGTGHGGMTTQDRKRGIRNLESPVSYEVSRAAGARSHLGTLPADSTPRAIEEAGTRPKAFRTQPRCSSGSVRRRIESVSAWSD
jgi:hypothetical protein